MQSPMPQRPSTQSYIPNSIEFIGKIRCPLHDSISYTQIEKTVIDLPEFQRLRRISQTAFMKFVFPGATHSRFEHSLGVMHLSEVFLTSLIQNQKQLLAQTKSALEKTPKILQKAYDLSSSLHGSILGTEPALEDLIKKPYLRQVLRFAALLHDIGHTPLSHSGERFLPTFEILEKNLDSLNLTPYLKNTLLTKLEALKKKSAESLQKKIRHEVWTLILISKMFVTQKNLDPNMGQDICSILEPLVPCAPNSELNNSGLRSLFHEIVSGEIDVDRMDYLLRDSRQCGVVYGIFDLGRILDSTAFYSKAPENACHLAITKSGIAAFEDYLGARWSMYQQVYFHKTATACEAMLQHIGKKLGGLQLSLDSNEYTKLDDTNFLELLRVESKKQKTHLKQYLNAICDDLFINRKLWKRLYEENFQQTRHDEPTVTLGMMNMLKKAEVPTEVVESSTNLTRFSPQGRSRQSNNSLKVIVRDIYELRFLEPVENHSTLINRTDLETMVRRVFVGRFQTNLEEIQLKDVKSQIMEQMFAVDNSD